jgi:thiol-disulfide isomerase/thioredoxin
MLVTTTTNEQRVFQPNVKIADSAFEFRPPAGARLLKRTNLMGLLNKPAPDFPYTAPDGSAKNLSDLRGKYVLLDFWALPLCEQHLPVLQSLSKSLPADTELLAVNFNGDSHAVADYLKKKSCSFPTVYADQQIAKVAGEQYGLRALPTILIIDKNGVVRAQFLGIATEKQILDRLKAIR